MQKTAAVLLIIGTAIAWIGESRPIITEIFSGAPNPQQVIDNDPSAWSLAMLLMAIGTVVVVAGMVVLSRHVRGINDDQRVRQLSLAAAAAALIGGLAYATGRVISAVTQTWEMSSMMENLGIAFWITFSILWQVALILTGYVLLRSGYPKWLAWPVMVIAGLILFGVVITGGLPPGIYYFAVLFLGTTLLFVREPQLAAAGTQLEGSSA
jgi:hypothetical protein